MDTISAARELVTSPLLAIPRALVGMASSNTGTSRWMQLLEYYNDPVQRTDWDIPVELRQLIDQACALSLPRNPIVIEPHAPLHISTRGMSPKKAHEVWQSVAYISNLFDSLGLDPCGVRIVDIGAGQGYLTRALQSHLGTTHLLALDSSEVQTRGAQRWEARTGLVGSITQKTIHITPDTLCESIDEWIHATTASQEENDDAAPVPVFLVALHACGSLTPDIVRAFFSQLNASAGAYIGWTPVGMMAVGCCYNLLAPGDFPLSKFMSTPPISLHSSAYHMAAQIPTQWFRTAESRSDATLALRKVVWRAIIGARFAKTLKSADTIELDGTGDFPVMRRLGRLNNTAYADWGTFAGVAGDRIGVNFGPDNRLDAVEQALISELEVLHVLRCILGPLVESLIIMDRERWIQEQLGESGDIQMQVEMVSLFDQATGSGRNIALVVAPCRLRD
ncbi:methyltransferase domain-containing protein [Mycena sp. CBHHK59/15]|nr:methyltransferase domain-containing protein [Mycena sp. CBHHK59/15]